MKILLVEPNLDRSDASSSIQYTMRSHLESPWAGYLAAIIGKKHEMKFINCAFPPTNKYGYFSFKRKKTITDEEIMVKFREFSPSVVCFSVYGYFADRVKSLSKKFKKINPDCKIILGGHYPTFTYKELLKNEWCDIIVVGEGFITFPELISCLDKKGDISTIAGISYLENDEVHYTGKRKPLKDLDFLPFPDRKIYPKCHTLEDNSISIISSTGCPWGQCTFCSIGAFYGGPHYATRSAKSILDELESLDMMNEVEFVEFQSDGILYRLEQIIDEKRKRNLDFKFKISARIDEILRRKDTVSYAKKNGLVDIFVGIENFSDRILKIYGKGITKNQIVAAFKVLDELGVHAHVMLILFAPWITPMELLYNLRMILNYAVWKDSKLCYIGLNNLNSHLAFLPGTKLHLQDGKHLDYENESIKRTADVMWSVKYMGSNAAVETIPSLHRPSYFSFVNLIISSIRGSDIKINKRKAELERLIKSKKPADMGLNEKYTVINEEDTPCLLESDFAISRLNDEEWHALNDLEETSPKKSEKLGVLIPVGGPYLVDVLNKKRVAITKDQLVYAQYALMGLTEKEIRKQLKYEKVPYEPCKMTLD